MAHVVAVDAVDVEAIEEGRRWRDALFFVVDRPDAAVDERGRRRLAEIVRDGAEHNRELFGPRQIVDPRASLVDHLQRVHPDVAFRMPLRFLRTADEREQSRETVSRRRRDRARAPSQSTGAAPAGAFRLLPRRVRSAGRRAESSGTDARRLVIQRKVQPRGELNRPQDAQAVVAKGGRIDHPQDAPFEVVPSAGRIEILAGQRIPGNRVDREIAAPGGLLDGHRGIAGDVESPCDRGRTSIRGGEATRQSTPSL